MRRMTSPDSGVVLFVGPHSEDHKRLSDILGNAPGPPGPAWTLQVSPSLRRAIGLLQQNAFPVVLCDEELGGESWQDLLEALAQLSNPPCLIVTSRLADDSLWAEALNLGAYDVLAKPFNASEVVRVVSSAWRHRGQPQQYAASTAGERPLPG